MHEKMSTLSLNMLQYCEVEKTNSEYDSSGGIVTLRGERSTAWTNNQGVNAEPK